MVPGARGLEEAEAVVADFHRRTQGRVMDLMTTDGYPAYETAILHTYGETVWPPPPPPGGWPAHGRSSQDSSAAERGSRPDQRATRFFLAGSVAIFLAGLGTAAVIAAASQPWRWHF